MAKKTAKKKAKSGTRAAPRKTASRAPRKSSLADMAFEAIKEKILKLYFLPGQYLNENALCSLLNMGRTPVHQALQRLQHEGLVEVMPRKGVIVQPGSIPEILKILDSRATVEAELARNAAERATAKDIEELKALARVGGSGTKSPELDSFIGADRAFHRKFAELAENPVLSDFARSLHERSIRYWYLHLWQTLDDKATIKQHTAIADAIARRDADAAAEAVRAHIESLRTRLMRAQDAALGRGPLHLK
ncbi:GntR family transcriptional regulator [Pseudorhodoplanes sp.]|uniref:GntR family transcriptional regulator n=1 Tax=Pseudorhodoplanes sp. TaxID=1934341 RepID=UPI002C63FD63|nr:GntR family transcriptional regulator [Pseudorhodoplanes sp.]HWV55699.1 GntR family transcriptional regulator [Pseudorhodoplanes sp.]